MRGSRDASPPRDLSSLTSHPSQGIQDQENYAALSLLSCLVLFLSRNKTLFPILIISLQSSVFTMRVSISLFHAALGVGFCDAVSAVTCDLKPSYTTPLTGDGWQGQLVATGLSKPRGILFDGSGNLLVVQAGTGILHLAFEDGGSTCLAVSKKTYLVNSTAVRLILSPQLRRY